jgi:hypothetical protein
VAIKKSNCVPGDNVSRVLSGWTILLSDGCLNFSQHRVVAVMESLWLRDFNAV